jgi:hypothetical protein
MLMISIGVRLHCYKTNTLARRCTKEKLGFIVDYKDKFITTKTSNTVYTTHLYIPVVQIDDKIYIATRFGSREVNFKLDEGVYLLVNPHNYSEFIIPTYDLPKDEVSRLFVLTEVIFYTVIAVQFLIYLIIL